MDLLENYSQLLKDNYIKVDKIVWGADVITAYMSNHDNVYFMFDNIVDEERVFMRWCALDDSRFREVELTRVELERWKETDTLIEEIEDRYNGVR